MTELVIKWTKLAKKDVADIKRYIAKDSIWYSKSVTSDIVLSARTIAKNPHKYTICPEYRDEGIRHKVVHGYRVIYEIQKSKILILGVVHESRLLQNVGNRFGN